QSGIGLQHPSVERLKLSSIELLKPALFLLLRLHRIGQQPWALRRVFRGEGKRGEDHAQQGGIRPPSPSIIHCRLQLFVLKHRAVTPTAQSTVPSRRSHFAPRHNLTALGATAFTDDLVVVDILLPCR